MELPEGELLLLLLHEDDNNHGDDDDDDGDDDDDDDNDDDDIDKVEEGNARLLESKRNFESKILEAIEVSKLSQLGINCALLCCIICP